MDRHESLFYWILAGVAALTIGGVVYVMNAHDDAPHAQVIQTLPSTTTPNVTTVPAGQTPVIIQQQPAAHQDSNGFWNGVMMGHWLSGSGSSNQSTHHTTEVRHVYHPAPVVAPAHPASAPAYHAPAYSAPKPTPAPAARPSFTPVSRPVSAIKTSSSPARSMSSSSFRSISSGRR